MKKIILIMILVSSQAIMLFAQDEPQGKPARTNDGEIKTLFKKSNHPVKIGYYIGPEAAYTQFKGRDVFLGGISLGMVINHFFTVGLGGYGILNSGNLWYDNIDPVSHLGAYLYGGYGGLKMEFKVWPASPVHLNFPILIGGGGMAYNTWTYHNNNYYNNQYHDDGITLDWDAFFVVEPGVMVELNLLKFMRLGAGMSYRYTPDLDLMNTSAGLINNFNANLTLKFGKF